jgi:multidrug efflux pump subunit AcrB
MKQEELLDKNIKDSVFAKIGVHKPYTVFVCIMAILILGVFAFTTLKTELFPKMNLPYAVATFSVDQNQLGMPAMDMPDMKNNDNVAALQGLLGADAGWLTDFQANQINIINALAGKDVPVDADSPQWKWINWAKSIKAIMTLLGDKAVLINEFTINQQEILAVILSKDKSTFPAGSIELQWISFAEKMGKMTKENSAKLATDVTNALSTVSGVKEIESISVSGAAMLIMEYSDGADVELGDLRSAIATVNAKLTDGTYGLKYSDSTTSQIVKIDPSLMAVFSFAATIDDAAGLTVDWYEHTLLGKLRATVGVGQITSKFENESTRNNVSWLGNGSGVKESLSFSIRKSNTTVTTDAVKNIITALDELAADYPEFTYTPILDQGEYIEQTLGSVAENLIIGGLLAIVILFLFLRSVKMTLAIAISIPLSIVATFVVMYFMGIGLNIVSMSALALAVGMLVDNSVVVLENIYRLRQKGMSVKDSAIKGASQIMGAMMASTLTTVCVFFPMFFLTGMIIQVFMDMVWVVILSLLCSLLVAIMFLPAIISSFKIGEKRVVKEKKEWKLWSAVKKYYDNALNFAINKKWWTVLIATVIFAGSVGLMFINGFILMPATDEGKFTADVTFKSDVKINQNLVENTVYTTVKDALGGDLDRVLFEYGSGLSMSSFLSGGPSAGNNLSLSVVLNENHKIATEKAAEKVYNALTALNNVENVSYSSSSMTDGLVASGISVVLQINEVDPILAHAKLKNAADAVMAEFIDANGNTLVDGVTHIESGYSQNAIKQISKKAVADFTLQVSADASISDVQAKVDKIIADLFAENAGGVFDGVSTVDDGFAKQLSETYWSLGIAIAVGLLLVYLVMVAVFQSFIMPAIVLICIPLAFTGAFLLLAICGLPLSVPALIGFLILMGVIVNNGILAVDYTNQARADGLNVKEALVASMHTRIRPIFMTAFTTIIALLPAAFNFSLFNTGEGGALMQPLAIASIGGMLYGTMMTLLVVPAFYAIFCRDKKQKTEQKTEQNPV